jgi:hypothetical protein
VSESKKVIEMARKLLARQEQERRQAKILHRGEMNILGHKNGTKCVQLTYFSLDFIVTKG